MRRKLVLGLALLIAVAPALAACGGEGGDATATTQVDEQDDSIAVGTGITTPAVGTDIPPAVPGGYTDLTPQQAKYLLDTNPDVVVIDVSPVYAEGHLPGAVSYYIGDGSLGAAIPTLDKLVPYLVYCHSDAPAIAGAELLAEAGFTTVYRLQGNYSAWVDAGYPVEK